MLRSSFNLFCGLNCLKVLVIRNASFMLIFFLIDSHFIFDVCFDFSKMNREFNCYVSNKNNSKTDPECRSPWFRDEENFSLKIV